MRRCWLTGRYGAIFMPCATLKNLTAGWENAFHGSQPDNNAVVYGTEECLTDALDYIRENRAPSILLIEKQLQRQFDW